MRSVVGKFASLPHERFHLGGSTTKSKSDSGKGSHTKDRIVKTSLLQHEGSSHPKAWMKQRVSRMHRTFERRNLQLPSPHGKVAK
jgi:hypothetical protein